MSYTVKVTPLSERQTLIQKALGASEKYGETIYDFKGDKFTPKVVSLPIDVPVYRMENCRTFTDQQNEIATRGLDKSYFAKGQELSTVQAEQHQILAKLAKRGTTSVSPIIDVIAKDGQREPILITSTGVVVNGNRRLAGMRELLNKGDGSVDTRFKYVECSVLPADTSPDEIDDIEANLQARPQTKLDYDWIGDAQLVRRQVNKGRSTKEVADQLRRGKAEIENLLQALDEADLYLSKWAEKPGQYSIVSGDAEQIFGDIPKRIADKDAKLQDASRVIAWSLFENREKLPGRLYAFNAAFGKLAPQVLEYLADQLDLSTSDESPSEDDDDFAIVIDDDGGFNYEPILEALRNDETKDDAVEALIEACETALERERGRVSEKAALKSLSQVHAKLTGIDVDSAGEATLPAMHKQVEAIRNVLMKIESSITARQNSIARASGAKGLPAK
ncbi:hypothetical protein [Agrobacterium leguminum]